MYDAAANDAAKGSIDDEGDRTTLERVRRKKNLAVVTLLLGALALMPR